MTLELTPDQAGILRGILDAYLRDMSYEIANTETYEYRQQLKERRDKITAIFEALGPDDATPD